MIPYWQRNPLFTRLADLFLQLLSGQSHVHYFPFIFIVMTTRESKNACQCYPAVPGRKQAFYSCFGTSVIRHTDRGKENSNWSVFQRDKVNSWIRLTVLWLTQHEEPLRQAWLLFTRWTLFSFLVIARAYSVSKLLIKFMMIQDSVLNSVTINTNF